MEKTRNFNLEGVSKDVKEIVDISKASTESIEEAIIATSRAASAIADAGKISSAVVKTTASTAQIAEETKQNVEKLASVVKDVIKEVDPGALASEAVVLATIAESTQTNIMLNVILVTLA